MDLRTKRILVTGGSGHLGRHVLARLRAIGCRRLSAPTHAECDLLDATAVRRILLARRPEVVLHLAARVGGIGANLRHPGTFLYENLVMGVQLIEECRKFGVEKFVAVGTICAYPKFTPVPFREEDLWNGYPEETNAAYGLAKKMLMVQLQAYRQEFDFPGVNVLLVNLYGPGDNFDRDSSHVIPALIRKCVEARERDEGALTVWGTGEPTREFLYVEDAARAIQAAAERLDRADPVNVGSGHEIAIRDLVAMIAERAGFRGEVRFDPSMPDGQPRRCVDGTRAREWLDFRATTPLAEGLSRTIAWYERSRTPCRSAA